MTGEWIHKMDDEGLTPMDRAFNSGHMALAEMMLRQEREDQTEVLSGTTPMHRAAYLGLHEAVKALLGYGADPNTTDLNGETPLHKAVREGHLDVVEALLNIADVNIASSSGMTPLHWACIAGNGAIVRALLSAGADPWIHNERLDDLTPVDLAYAMQYGELTYVLSNCDSYVHV